MSIEQASLIRFGVFEIDLTAGELRKQGVKLKLQEQPFQVLALLLERPGQVVTRDELQKRLWSTDTFVDFDRGLNKAINRVREALEDSADSPRFIETLPKRGYRFIAPTAQARPSVGADLSSAASETTHKDVVLRNGRPAVIVQNAAPVARTKSTGFSARKVSAWGVAVLLLVAFALVAATYFRRSPQSEEHVLRASLLPPPGTSFLPSNFALSPDGTQLAFVDVDQDGRTMLWVRALSAARARRLEGTDEATFPFWSPDDRYIGFFALRKLKTLELSSGVVRTLADAPVGHGGTWNSGGIIVFAPSVAGPLYRIDAGGGVPVPLTRIPDASSGEIHLWPSFLPDGKHFLFYLFRRANPLSNGIYIGTLGSSETKLLSSEVAGNVVFSSGHLLYVRERSLVAQPFDLQRLQTTGPFVSIAEQELDPDAPFSRSGFTVSDASVVVFQSTADFATRLAWFDRSGRELGIVPTDAYSKDPSLSPDGRLLAVSSDDGHDGKYYIRVYNLARNVSTRLTTGGRDSQPIWSRDGKNITYISDDGKMFSTQQVAADGSSSSLMLKGAVAYPNDWSPGGQLAFMRVEKGLPFLAIYSATDRSVVSFGPGAEAQFSPDGKWVAYIGQGGVAGGGGIVVQPFPGPGAHIQISDTGGAQPRWSRDGTEIFYMAPDRTLMAVAFDSKIGAVSAPRTVFRTRIMAPNLVGFQYDIGPDGRFIVNSFPITDPSPLTLLAGWTAAH